MPRYKLRTLLIVLAIGPMVAAWIYDGAMNQFAMARRKALLERRQVLADKYRAGTIPLAELEKFDASLKATTTPTTP